MSKRQIVRRAPAINPLDALFCASLAICAGYGVFVQLGITVACWAGLGVYIGSILCAHFRRVALHHQRFANTSHRLEIAQLSQQVAELELRAKRPEVAVINRSAEQDTRNVVEFDSDVREAFPELAQRLLVDNANLSRNGLAGLLSRSQVESLQKTLCSIGLAEIATNNACHLTDDGRAFFERYLPE